MRVRVVAVAAVLLVVGCAPESESSTSTAAELTTLAPVSTEATSPPRTIPVTLPAAAPDGLCRSYEDPAVAGTVTIEAVREISGVASSNNYADVIWMHNDSRGGPFLYATTSAGAPLGTFELDAATFDWEDMALGPGPEETS